MNTDRNYAIVMGIAILIVLLYAGLVVRNDAICLEHG